jgi:hypothetical protein
MEPQSFRLTFNYMDSARHAAPVFRHYGMQVKPGSETTQLIVTLTHPEPIKRLKELLGCMAYNATIGVA